MNQNPPIQTLTAHVVAWRFWTEHKSDEEDQCWDERST